MRLSRHAGTCNRTLQPGFTLAETMVVLVIAAMMITLAIPRVDVTRYKSDAIAQIVRTQLQNASRSAITRQHDVIVSFDTLGEQMVTAFDANNNGVVDTGRARLLSRARHRRPVRRPVGQRHLRRGDQLADQRRGDRDRERHAVADLPPRRLGELGRGDLRLDRGARSEDVPRSRR